MGVSKASLRGLRLNERVAKMREASKATQKTVRVSPKNSTLRMVLRHPRAGGFPKEGPVDWPDDRFTQRRIRDGDIKREDDPARPDEHDKPRSHRKHEDSNAA